MNCLRYSKVDEWFRLPATLQATADATNAKENVHPLELYCEPGFPGICHIYIFINNNSKLHKQFS